MEKLPYSSFWKEEPENLKKSWRPTDGVRRKITFIGLIQLFLLVAIVVVSILISRETKKLPPIFAALPDGLVLQTTQVVPGMDRLARRELVNNTLPLLYYQEGADNYLMLLKDCVRGTILGQAAYKMHGSADQTNSTVRLEIIDTFETSAKFSGSKIYFEAMTKAELIKEDRKKRTSVPFYLRSHWEFEDEHFVLTGVIESNPSDYATFFDNEKARLHSLTPEELQRELNIRKNSIIPVIEQNAGKL